ncbi:hypothetical protein DPMN_075312 [Dreissena polymorpha]|uniref:Uncharacterized protein n=1 Tax=Dreissena polymorpha TaxID=45954 RepID=A0A9D4BMI8_DREPO|nr:hypothetical protein DPMN_075312 [Dreissena polymorpha]
MAAYDAVDKVLVVGLLKRKRGDNFNYDSEFRAKIAHYAISEDINRIPDIFLQSWVVK